MAPIPAPWAPWLTCPRRPHRLQHHVRRRRPVGASGRHRREAVKVLAWTGPCISPCKSVHHHQQFHDGPPATAAPAFILNRGYIDPGISMPVMPGVLLGSLMGTPFIQANPDGCVSPLQSLSWPWARKWYSASFWGEGKCPGPSPGLMSRWTWPSPSSSGQGS